MIPNLRCQRFQISSTGWINVSNRITTPVNTTSMKVEIHNGMFNGWIAYDDLTLKQVGSSTSLLPDPGFENTTSGWTTGQLSDFPTTMLWKGTWGPGAPRTGTYSYIFSILRLRSGQVWADGYWRTLQLAARAGEQYDLYAYIRGELDADTTQGRFLIRAKFMDSNGASLGYSDITAMYPGAISSWTRVGGRVTAPANSVSMQVQYLLYMSSGWVNIDDVEMTIVPPNAATEVTKYYYFGGQRVAMRKNGVLTYLHGDHLGSTVLETNITGTVTTDEKYLAYGKQRDSGKVTTDHRFTGQKEDASGLQYFNARFYNPVSGMFVSPDTIVPQPGLASDYNRYLAFRGNPFMFVDPSGHFTETALKEYLHNKNLDYLWDDWSKDEAWMNLLYSAEGGDAFAYVLQGNNGSELVTWAKFNGQELDRLDSVDVVANPIDGESVVSDVSLDGIRTNPKAGIASGLIRKLGEENYGVVPTKNFPGRFPRHRHTKVGEMVGGDYAGSYSLGVRTVGAAEAGFNKWVINTFLLGGLIGRATGELGAFVGNTAQTVVQGPLSIDYGALKGDVAITVKDEIMPGASLPIQQFWWRPPQPSSFQSQ